MIACSRLGAKWATDLLSRLMAAGSLRFWKRTSNLRGRANDEMGCIDDTRFAGWIDAGTN